MYTDSLSQPNSHTHTHEQPAMELASPTPPLGPLVPEKPVGWCVQVCNNNDWKEVVHQLKLDKAGASPNSIKAAYTK